MTARQITITRNMFRFSLIPEKKLKFYNEMLQFMIPSHIIPVFSLSLVHQPKVSRRLCRLNG